MFRNILFGAAVAIAAIGTVGATQTSQSPITQDLLVYGAVLPHPSHHAEPGTPTGRTCDFSRQDVFANGRMSGAGVQCRRGATVTQLLANAPRAFNAYCVADARRLMARVTPEPMPGNPEHCELSGITPRQAETAFGVAIWR